MFLFVGLIELATKLVAPMTTVGRVRVACELSYTLSTARW